MPDGDLWNRNHPAIWKERAPGEDRGNYLRHPSYPYEQTTGNLGALTAIASQYLQKVGALFELPALFDPHASHPGQFSVPLAWLQISEEKPAPPRASFWITRYDTSASPPAVVDRTIVLLAVQSAIGNEPERAIGSRLGIRVVAHVDPEPANGMWKVRITGSTCSTGSRRSFRTRSRFESSSTTSSQTARSG